MSSFLEQVPCDNVFEVQDTFFYIVQFLQVQDIEIFKAVNSRTRSMITSMVFWKVLIQAHFGENLDVENCSLQKYFAFLTGYIVKPNNIGGAWGPEVGGYWKRENVKTAAEDKKDVFAYTLQRGVCYFSVNGKTNEKRIMPGKYRIFWFLRTCKDNEYKHSVHFGRYERKLKEKNNTLEIYKGRKVKWEKVNEKELKFRVRKTSLSGRFFFVRDMEEFEIGKDYVDIICVEMKNKQTYVGQNEFDVVSIHIVPSFAERSWIEKRDLKLQGKYGKTFEFYISTRKTHDLAEMFNKK